MPKEPERGSPTCGAHALAAMAGALAGLAALVVLTALAPAPPPAGAAPGSPPAATVAAGPLLRLVPLTGPPVELGAADLEKLPRRSLQVAYPAGAEHQGSPAEVSGVPLRALLDRLGVPAGHDLRGEALQLYIVAEGADGYKAVLALAEIDASFTDQTVLVADRRGGKPLSEQEGPLRLIVPTDKRPARWVRQLVRIAVRRAS